MKRVTEYKSGKLSYFVVDTIIAGKVIDTTTVFVHTAEIEKDGKIYYLLYDSNYNIIESAYMFMNHRKKNLSECTMANAHYALRYLYSFAEIFGKKVEDLDHDEFVSLAYFLKGMSMDDTQLELHLLTKRSSTTVNLMFSSFRSYYRYLHLDGPIFDENSWSRYTPASKTYKPKVNPFNARPIKEIPKYISVDEFTSIVEWIRSNVRRKAERLRDEALVRLMFEGGLRIGEALGSTLEDFIPHTVKNVSGEEMEICFVYIRNRVSDRHDFQNAKGCMNVSQRGTYAGHDYQTRNVGYQLSFISMDTYKLIMEYIDEAHVAAKKKYKKNYAIAEADAVGLYKEEHKVNHYVFLNSLGRPMSDETWRVELRKIFLGVGLDVDTQKRQNGLSHRFRHGFCMHLLYDLKMPKHLVRLRSRHNSESGLDKYDTPSVELIAEIQLKIEDNILRNDLLWQEN